MNFRLFRKQNLFLSLVLFVGVLISTNSIFSYDISYQDLIASRDDVANSELAKEFKGLSSCYERLKKLLSKCECVKNWTGNEFFRLRVVNILNKTGVENFYLDVEFNLFQKEYLWVIKYPNTNFDLINASLFVNYEKRIQEIERCDLDALKSLSQISGNIIMNIFDALCYLLAIPKVTLQDESSVGSKFLSSKGEIFKLKILRPYASKDHKTWYEKFGYVKARNREEYEASLNFLVNRPIREFVEDFAYDEEVLAIVNKYYLRLKCDIWDLPQNSDRSISDLVKVIYTESKNDPVSLKALAIIYNKCLANYKAFEDRDNLIESEIRRKDQILIAQKIVCDGDLYWKSYLK